MPPESTVGDGPGGARCPHCREPLRANLYEERIVPVRPIVEGPGPPTAFLYCGSCGATLHVVSVPSIPLRGPVSQGDLTSLEVEDPEDAESPEGRFQLRCRQLITEIRLLGLTPFVWIETINSFGAVGAVKRLLADHQGLVATPWLIERGRQELTMEHEFRRARWDGLFTDEERAEGARRLERAGGAPR